MTFELSFTWVSDKNNLHCNKSSMCYSIMFLDFWNLYFKCFEAFPPSYSWWLTTQGQLRCGPRRTRTPYVLLIAEFLAPEWFLREIDSFSFYGFIFLWFFAKFYSGFSLFFTFSVLAATRIRNWALQSDHLVISVSRNGVLFYV